MGKPLSRFVSIFFYGNEIGFGKVGVGRGIGICGQIRTESQKIKLGSYNLIFSNMYIQSHIIMYIYEDRSNIHLYVMCDNILTCMFGD